MDVEYGEKGEREKMNRPQILVTILCVLFVIAVIIGCSVTGDKPVNTSGGDNIGVAGWQWYQVLAGFCVGHVLGVIITLFVVKLDLIKNRV